MLTAYRPLFTSSTIRQLVTASLIARLTLAIFAIPLILVVREVTHSYALAGLVMTVFSIGVALTAPIRGYLVDRYGSRLTLPPLVMVSSAALMLLPLAANAHLIWVIMGLTALMGVSIPPLTASMRVEWQKFLGISAKYLTQAYAFESVAQTALFVIGPMLASACIVNIGAKLTLTASGVMLLVGGLAFSALALAQEGQNNQSSTRYAPIRLSGIRAVILATLLADSALGAVEVTVVAFANQRGTPALGGLLFSLFALGSVIGGLIYGARIFKAPLSVQLIVIFFTGALTLVLLALARSSIALGILLIFAGAPAAPGWTAASLVLDKISDKKSTAETFTWLNTANGIGLALGSALAGVLIQIGSTTFAFIGTGITVALAATTVMLFRRSLIQSPQQHALH